MSDWHTIDASEVVRRLGTDAFAGLAEAEAARRLQEHGRNEIAEGGGRASRHIGPRVGEQPGRTAERGMAGADPCRQ